MAIASHVVCFWNCFLISGAIFDRINVRASHIFNKKPIDMVDDGGSGDFGASIDGDPSSTESGAGDSSNSMGGDGSSSNFLKQIGGGNGSNFVSCNFYIGLPGCVCCVFVGVLLNVFCQGDDKRTEKIERKLEEVDTWMDALRAIEESGEKKARHPFSSKARKKKREIPQRGHFGKKQILW